MKRKALIIVITLLLSLILASCTQSAANISEQNYRDLKIIGDINNVINIGDIDESYNISITNNSIQLSDIIASAEPFSKGFSILIVGNDGLMAEVEGEKVSDCSLKHEEGIGWCSITEKHPVSTKIKDVKEIVVISKDNDLDIGTNIFTKNKNILNITPGQLYLMRGSLVPYIDGKSKKDYEDEVYRATVYKEKKLLNLKDIIPEYSDKPLLAFGGQGEYQRINEGFLELYENKINYVNIDTREYIKDLKGILIDPPANTNMDLYYDVEHYLNEDEKVLVLFVDGLSYEQSIATGFDDKYEVHVANTIFKPVTNAGFAAMITGKPPIENGVLNRDYRELKCETIFDLAEKMSKSTTLVEAELKILNTKLDPILNIDSDDDDLVDDDVFEKSLKILDEAPDLLMVHFHSIDDFGHKYGDMDTRTHDQIGVIDGYIDQLKSKWDGRIIITSDHGMHSVAEGGYHGSARYEDIIIPYIITKGEK